MPLDQVGQVGREVPKSSKVTCRVHYCYVRSDYLKSHYHWWSQGAALFLPAHPESICVIDFYYWMTCTLSVPDGLLEPWHLLWLCVCCRWSGESLYWSVTTQLSYCFSTALVYSLLSDSITVWATLMMTEMRCSLSKGLQTQKGMWTHHQTNFKLYRSFAVFYL